MPLEQICKNCSVSQEQKTLKKCPICFRYVCDDCSYFFAGRYFCGRGCSQLFFFGTGDENEE